MKAAYKASLNGTLRLNELTSRLSEISDKAAHYETIELCHEVMAADGVADTEELKAIRKIAESLGLDLDEVKKIQDQKIISLDSTASGQADIEEFLGIDKSWSKEKIKRYLRDEFQKWNNRLNTLEPGSERDNAQQMIDKISEARKKYA